MPLVLNNHVSSLAVQSVTLDFHGVIAEPDVYSMQRYSKAFSNMVYECTSITINFTSTLVGFDYFISLLPRCKTLEILSLDLNAEQIEKCINKTQATHITIRTDFNDERLPKINHEIYNLTISHKCRKASDLSLIHI